MKFAFVCTVLAACGGSPSPAPSHPAPGQATGACGLVTAAEVEQITSKRVVIAPDQTVNDGAGNDTCAYAQPESGVVVAIITTHAHGDFHAITADAFTMSNPPTPLSSLGDEARYAEFKNGKGSNVVLRTGGTVVVIGGSEHDKEYTQIAKLLLRRLHA